MAKRITEKEVEIINNYYAGLTEVAREVLSSGLDVEMTLEQEFFAEVPDAGAFQGSHAVCALRCTNGYLGYSLLAFPEELIATISDIIMGGSGMDVYKGSLTELEINASAGMFENLFEKIRDAFKKEYKKDLDFASVPRFVSKGSSGYDEAFSDGIFDVYLSCKIKINGTQEFSAVLLMTSDELINSMKNLGLIVEAASSVEVQPTPVNLTPQVSTKMNTYDIRKLADVKIDITAELGRAQVSIKQVLSLVRGSILELDTMEGTDIVIFANGSEVAKAQVVVVDGHFGIKITKILDPLERFKSI